MQPRFGVKVLVLQAERLMNIGIDAVFCVQCAPGGIAAVPKQVAVDIGDFLGNADLVVVKIIQVELLVFILEEDFGQRFVGILVGVNIGIVAFVVVFLQQSAAVPDEVGAFGGGAYPGQFVFAFFGEASAEGGVGVCPDFGIALWLLDFGADQLVFGIVLKVLFFAIGQFAVDEVAQGVVGVFGALVFFEAVAVADIAAFVVGVGLAA